MKKICSFALIVLSLLSCAIFSACGNKYDDLRMRFYSSDGEELSKIEFVIDDSKDSSQTVGIEFDGVDKEDIGQVLVYSIPQELVTVNDYRFNENRCYVDIEPNMSNSGNAKLVVAHLASGKKKEIDLVVNQKASNLELVTTDYAIAIPQTESVNHFVDFSQILNLLPSGSTDKVYFKILPGKNPASNVHSIALTDVEGYEDVYTGFEVSSGNDSSLTIYPVTYMSGYERKTPEPFIGKQITVYFKNALTQENVKVNNIANNAQSIELITKDDSLDMFKLSLVDDKDVALRDGNVFDFYNLDVESDDNLKVSTFIDANKDILLKANAHTDSFVNVKIVLTPKFAGNLQVVEKTIEVRVNSNADYIQTTKGGVAISTDGSINIFDYYDDGGNSLGTLFTFKPIANSGSNVHEDLKTMQIIINPEILSANNILSKPEGVEVDAMLYSLVFNHISVSSEFPFKEAALLKFTFDATLNKMVSEEIDEDSQIYIKYIKHNAESDRLEPTDFGIQVKTVNNSNYEYWKDVKQVSTNLSFNRLEGVVKMGLEAGYYHNQGNNIVYTVGQTVNPEYIYLDRTKGIDNSAENVHRTFVNIVNSSVEGVNGGKISSIDFNVEINPLSTVDNPLAMNFGLIEKDGETKVEGVSELVYKYDRTADNDYISLILRKDTGLGQYKITFFQEGIEKASVVCVVYEGLHGIEQNAVEFETNLTAFKNEKYTNLYESQYIVASGQTLGLTINLPQDVLNSGIVEEYDFTDFSIKESLILPAGVEDETQASVVVTDYFDCSQDDTTYNNAVLSFKKGTFIKEKPQYVSLTIVIKTKTYLDITTESPELDDSNKITISFFIYEEINNKDLSINHTSMTRYFKEYMGKYYEDESKAELEVEMQSDLWNYVTTSNKVDWRIDKVDGVSISYVDKSCMVEFSSLVGSSRYERTVKAYIQQFENLFELKCVFNVEKPILTEKIIINSELHEANGEFYINLKKGKDYTVEATNYSSLGQVTHNRIRIQVADEFGAAYTATDYFTIDQTNSKITVNAVDNVYNFKLYVFAEDVLNQIISSDKTGYNNPVGFILNNFTQAVDVDRYINAFFVINIHLSDGTVETPYEIHTYEDFWEIDDSFELSKAHYRLMSSISLDNGYDGSKVIENFTGSITTPAILDKNGNIVGYETYTIDGITLNATNPNLFVGFKINDEDELGVSGKISNVRFVVKYDYTIINTKDLEVYLGLFDRNGGTLENVKVEVSGSATLSGSAKFYFGSLVGENYVCANSEGIVSNGVVYNSGYGVSGKISIQGENTTKIYFGGIVGKNTHTIEGYETSSSVGGGNEIILNATSGSLNAISMIKVVETNLYGEGENGSAIGGVVGYNTGIIKNAFVQAVIDANSSNVGGVIGINNFNVKSFVVSRNGSNVIVDVDTYVVHNGEKFLKDEFKHSIYNVKSASIINAKNNVGGIVGCDINGLYVECDYQVLNTDIKEVALKGNNFIGGIAGCSTHGKFVLCSVMSYNWNYAGLNGADKTQIDATKLFVGVADISGEDFVGGIVGNAISDMDIIQWQGATSLDISTRTIVVNSSVNAYLHATKVEDDQKTGSVGGIISASGMSILYNVYFIGKLDGNVVYEQPINVSGQSLCLDNDNSSIYNSVYTINIDDQDEISSIVAGGIYNGYLFTNWYDQLSSLEDVYGNRILAEFWGWNKDVNGGHVFITNDKDSSLNSLPIFDLAPERINVTVKDEYKKADLERVLMLEYFDFSMNLNLTEEKLLELHEENNNVHYIKSLLNIVAQPSGLGNVVIKVRSTNTAVIDINFDGKLLINGVGETDLIFSSVLKANAGNEQERTIRVIVDYPIGDMFAITAYPNDEGEIVNTTQKISQGTTKQYYIITKGSKIENSGLYNEKEYFYKTKNNVHLNVEVAYNTLDAEFDIAEYVSISGTSYLDIENDGTKGEDKVVVKLTDKTPLTISVLKMLESDVFAITVKPYVVVNGKEIYDIKTPLIRNAETPVEAKTLEHKFNLSTVKGVSDVSFSYDDAIVYPNDTVYLTIQLGTDEPLCPRSELGENGEVLINTAELQEMLKELIEGNETVQNEFNMLFNIYKSNILINYNINVEWSKFNAVTQIQTITLRIEFEDMAISVAENLKLSFETIGNSSVVDFRILPQRIDKIEIKNYYYRNETETEKVREQADILKPNYPGLIVIDMVPNNAYYDYLEISDITGNEEIVFIQIRSEDGQAYNIQDVSSDGKGIKLYAYENSSRLYVRTQISNTYSSKTHIIEVRAYDSDGTQLGGAFRKQIDVKMLPEIEFSYILPDGSFETTINSTEVSEKGGLYLANGVDATLNIVAKNANSEIEITKSGTGAGAYTVEKISGNIYRLKATHDEANIGKKIKITATVYAYMDNGDYDMAQCSLEFEIISFVIHGVSVNNSIDNLTTKEIYGYYDREISLKFFFDETDVSYYDENQNQPFWNTVYQIGDDYDNSNKDLTQIYSILTELNSFDTNATVKDKENNNVSNAHYGVNDYLILNDTTKNTVDKLTYNEVEVSNISLTENNLVVSENYNPQNLAVAFKVYYLTDNVSPENSGWKITNYTNNEIDNGYLIDKNYKLNFTNVTQWGNPDVINTEEEFLNMSSGKEYILNADLTFEQFIPMDVDLIAFDGNGHTITINSFANFLGTTLDVGLFAKVYPNMIVKNVGVKYISLNIEGNYSLGYVVENKNGTYNVTYADLTLGSTAKDVQFGGLAAVNEGIITNCVVSGLIALNASTLSNSGSVNIPFNLGGLVAENTSTGYITNSSSELSIFTLANVGGFVHTNAGKIVSCSVEETTTIYAYDATLGNTIEGRVAGFALENSGEISMSYVNLKAGEIDFEYANKNIKENTTSSSVLTMNGGTMSVKDISAGFVFSNTGTIYDAYVQMTQNGVNNNIFVGFVYSNSGSISRAYTFINGGKKDHQDDAMFAPATVEGNIENCVEFMVDVAGNENEIEGLTTVSASSRYVKSIYENCGFAFGDNESAVWSIVAGSLPKLVSTQELKFEDFDKTTIALEVDDNFDDGVDNTKYEVKYLSYGTKNNPFIIYDLKTWNYYFDIFNNQGLMNGYYRIVKDIDFASIGKNPMTSEIVFRGNIQGNNMKLMNIMLYSTDSLNSLGLFRKLEGLDDYSIKNAVRNLTISTTSVWASSTESVGILAGIIENFNIYNITIDAENVIMVGKNAVGGLAGLIHGEFDIDFVKSNIGANSTRASTLSNYSIFMSKNNYQNVSANIKDVYYAGSVVGILDGYKYAYDINDATREISKNYFKVRNVYVSGNLTLAGDTVGGAFGFVGERVFVQRVNVNITGSVFGSQYSSGIAGENRGVIDIADVNLADNLFANARYVASGAVGLNLGGLVRNVNVNASISKSNFGYTVGGIVGRNVNGTIANTEFNGEVYAYIAGGIVGADYNKEIILSATSGNGAINASCKANSQYLVVENVVNYTENGNSINSYDNVSLTYDTIQKMIENLSKFYSYKNDGGANNSTLSAITIKNKVLGLVVGLSCRDDVVRKQDNTYKIMVEKTDKINRIIFNVENNKISGVTFQEKAENVLLKDESQDVNDVKFTFKNVNVVNLNLTASVDYVMYLVGSNVTAFDSWSTYSNDYIVIQ